MGDRYADTQAFLAVEHAKVDAVLREGYRCSRRSEVPVYLGRDMWKAARALRRHHDISDTVILEVYGVDEFLINRERGKIMTTHLAPCHLRKGIVGSHCYQHVPCTYCGELLPEAESERGLVGLARFFEEDFVVVPCPNPGCREAQHARQQRLNDGPELILYHQTSRENADSIWWCGGKLLRGPSGAAGAGIYFAETARHTEHKAEHHGVVLECRVRVGKQHAIEQHDKKPVPITFTALARMGCDSLLVDRGLCWRGKHKGEPAGNEIVVYSWDQVQVIREVDRDYCWCPQCRWRKDKK